MRASELASAAFESDDVVLGSARQLNQGFFFPAVAKRVDVFSGVIINKETGRHLMVVVGSPMAEDLTLYDRGYQFDHYDVVVFSIEDLDQTVRTLLTMHAMITDVYYRYGRVYRVGRGLNEAEVRDRLTRLPCVFSGSMSYVIPEFEKARAAGWFAFKVLEYRGKK